MNSFPLNFVNTGFTFSPQEKNGYFLQQNFTYQTTDAPSNQNAYDNNVHK